MAKKIIGMVSFMNAAGAQEAMMRLMRQLRLRGHDTETWFLYEKSSCYRGQPGVEVILPKSRLTLADMPVLFSRLLAMLRARRPHAVIGFLPLANIMGQVAAQMAGVPVRIASQRSPGSTFNPAMQAIDRVRTTRAGEKTFVVCHGGLINAIIGALGNDHTTIVNTSITTVTHDGTGWGLVAYNETPHLEPLAAPAD